MSTITVAEDDVVLSREEVSWIVEALILGLTSYGELEKVLSAKQMTEALGGEWPRHLDVRHPGPDDIVSKFACALMTLRV